TVKYPARGVDTIAPGTVRQAGTSTSARAAREARFSSTKPDPPVSIVAIPICIGPPAVKVRNCLTAWTASRTSAEAITQPIFHPVVFQDLPAEDTSRVVTVSSAGKSWNTTGWKIGLARRGDRDDTRGVLDGHGRWHMCLVGEDELFVDFVGHDPGVGGLGGAADPRELVRGEDVPGRIVRGVDEDDRGPDLGHDRIEAGR